MSEDKKATTTKKASEKGPSPFPDGLFQHEAAEKEAIELLNGRDVAWAHRQGRDNVRFLTLPDGQEVVVRDAATR